MQKKLKRKRTLILLSIILFILAGLGVYYFISHNSNNEIEQGTVRYDPNPNPNHSTTDTGNIIFPAYTDDLFFTKEQKNLPIELVNPKVNKDIFLQYKISITDENKIICIGQTKLIESGQAVNNLEVDQTKLEGLKPNVYKCRIDVFAFKFKDKNKKEKIKLNQAYWDVKLHLK